MRASGAMVHLTYAALCRGELNHGYLLHAGSRMGVNPTRHHVAGSFQLARPCVQQWQIGRNGAIAACETLMGQSSSCSRGFRVHGPNAVDSLPSIVRLTARSRALFARRSSADPAAVARRRSRRSRDGDQLRVRHAAGHLLGILGTRLREHVKARTEGARSDDRDETVSL